jgi:hypothetical protein
LATAGSPGEFNIPESFMPAADVRYVEETKARLADSTARLVNITSEWKESYGTLPASLQSQLKTLHLHSCTRRLGIDLVGVVDQGEGRFDCILRSPGLRPRHWASIVKMLPRTLPPKGLDVWFPARFTLSGEDEEITGGQKLDLEALLTDDSLSEDKEEEDWDAMDQEELEALKVISSAANVYSMSEIDLDQYPRLMIKDFGDDTKAVDRLLKVLLPVAKVVYEKQEEDKDQAKVAANLREKQENLQKRKKKTDVVEAQRTGYKNI